MPLSPSATGFFQTGTAVLTPEKVQAAAFSESVCIAIEAQGGFTAGNDHFQTTPTSSVIIAGVADTEIIVYGVSLITNASEGGIFACGIAQEDEDTDLMVGGAADAGPYFLDFAQPLKLAEGKGLYAWPITKGSVNILSVRYSQIAVQN